MAHWYCANVLQSTPGGRRLWRFSAKGDRFQFDQEKTLTLNEPAPAGLVGKDWQSLLRPKLNVAWLPADKVFLRAIQLPAADSVEVAAMVELQLEKISPLPVTHIVWSFYVMPQPENKPEELQSVIVIIAARAYVEELLGELEVQGFQPDRIEAPGLDQLLSAKMDKDGVWLFPGGTGEPALIAWHYGGAIHNLTILPVPPGADRGALLKGHIEHVAWAGELEGWLTGPVQIELVADKTEAAVWESLLAPWADQGVDVIAPSPTADLAAVSAQRSGNNGASTNLLPAEFSQRYHQQFVDRLWMRGLLGVVAVYLVAVLAYFAFLYEYNGQLARKRLELVAKTPAFIEAQQDLQQVAILKERQNLKYLALDCWKAMAESMPESLTVDRMSFQPTKFDLQGTATTDEPTDIYTFNEAMRHSMDSSLTNLLFTEVSPPKITTSGNRSTWSFTCSLRSIENQ